MRVIEPHHFNEINKKKSRKRKLPSSTLLIPVLMTVFVVGYVFYGQNFVNHSTETNQENDASAIEEPSPQPEEAKELTLGTFTDEEFKQLYTTYAYPNTQALVDYPEITGNPVADERIHKLAEARGYKLSSVPVSSIVKINEPYLTDDDLLQPNAKIGWDALKAAAKKDNIPLQITSAYRSIELQRATFLRIMADEGVTVNGVADGYSDLALERVMNRVAPPGFSRHHNGYTIDFACDGIGLYGFKNTSCYDWISKNNFEVAKTFGWVPSYPEEAEQQGPMPEPWEFIWVGTINLYQ